jgi:RNA polymerase sigma factor (TIGR02999 family)
VVDRLGEQHGRSAPDSGWNDTAMTRSHNLTAWLVAWRKGDQTAEAKLVAAVYEDLRRIARRRLRAERRGHSLVPTALVHEAYLRLLALRRLEWQNRAQFFAIAARVMRRILVDHARVHDADKRGGTAVKVSLTAQLGAALPVDVDLIDLDHALTSLAAVHPRHAHLVELRFFGGFTIEEAAEVLGRSPASLKRDWAAARAWLFRHLRGLRQPERLDGMPGERRGGEQRASAAPLVRQGRQRQ